MELDDPSLDMMSLVQQSVSILLRIPMMAITQSDVMPISSERSDARLS